MGGRGKYVEKGGALAYTVRIFHNAKAPPTGFDFVFEYHPNSGSRISVGGEIPMEGLP